MFVKTCFQQNCPSCSRVLRITVDLLGRDVVCEHCDGRFTALDPDATESPGELERHLLLVQPNREHLSSLARRFTEIGYRVTPVHHPRQALEAATFKSFHVAVIDGSLPEIDARELSRRLHRRVMGLRIVLLVDVETELAVVSDGADDLWMVLEKPTAIRRLETIVDEALGGPHFARRADFGDGSTPQRPIRRATIEEFVW